MNYFSTFLNVQNLVHVIVFTILIFMLMDDIYNMEVSFIYYILLFITGLIYFFYNSFNLFLFKFSNIIFILIYLLILKYTFKNKIGEGDILIFAISSLFYPDFILFNLIYLVSVIFLFFYFIYLKIENYILVLFSIFCQQKKKNNNVYNMKFNLDINNVLSNKIPFVSYYSFTLIIFFILKIFKFKINVIF